MDYRDAIVENFILRFEKEIDSRSIHKVINGEMPEQRITDFKEGEDAGRNRQKKLSIEILKELLDIEPNKCDEYSDGLWKK